MKLGQIGQRIAQQNAVNEAWAPLGYERWTSLAASKMAASIATVLTVPVIIPFLADHPARPDGLGEARAGGQADQAGEARHTWPAEFWDAWVKTDKDQVRDKRTIKDGVGAAPTSGAGSAPGSAPAAASFAGALPAVAASHHCSAPRRPRQPEPRKLWQPWQIRLGKHRRRLPTSS